MAFIRHGDAVATQWKIAQDAVEDLTIEIHKEARKEVQGGFTSGAFVTGRLAQNIDYEVDRTIPKGEIGSTLDYALYWEAGHYNIFIGSYIRRRWLTRAMVRGRAKSGDILDNVLGGVSLEAPKAGPGAPPL